MERHQHNSRWMLISSMIIFSTIGILRKYIPLSSALVALVRAVVGTGFLALVVFVKRMKFHRSSLKRKLLPLLLSGIALSFNWILLFESYRYTTVSTATLCYYLAPILVILLSPVFLKEKLTGKQLLCTAAALIGTVLVSGITDGNGAEATNMKGILFGLGAAGLYAAVMLLNKILHDIPPFDKTIFQLAVSACVLAPYTFCTEDLSAVTMTPTVIVLLLVAGIVHTGIAYWLYFGAIPNLPGQTVALYSYLDPILAIILSTALLHEPMTVSAMIGAVLILSAAYFSDR